ncbi:MAG: hypothetical protein JO340_20430 [Acidobacteriaceae bacterium]|nr:hypothetical protein [Acidobacteriaceae bacterium]
MRIFLKLMVATLLPACILSAIDLQGVIADWNCTQDMVRNGRSKVLKQNRNCSLVKNYNRGAYGLITMDKKFYRLDDNGNKLARELLANTPDKDNLKVIVSGDIDGDTIKVINMSEL